MNPFTKSISMKAPVSRVRKPGTRPRVLVVTSLFPRPDRPLWGVFNFQSVSALKRFADLQVISPISFVDKINDLVSKHVLKAGRKSSSRPVYEAGGLSPIYPLYLSIPFLGRWLNGYLQHLALIKEARRMHGRAPFDVILCYWIYPDGYAARLLSVRLGIPYIVVALGSDLNIIGHAEQTRGVVYKTLADSAQVITVSEALCTEALNLGASREKCMVIRNGVDRNLFHPLDRSKCRDDLKIDEKKKVLLFVGTLDPIKGPDILIEALSLLREDERPLTLIVGAGPSRRALQKKTQKLGLAPSVRFISVVPYGKMPVYLNAADLLCLPSRHEGCPNVILEAQACGTPVIASSVGGIPELITQDMQGVMVKASSSENLAAAIKNCLARTWDRNAIALSGKRSWDDVARETREVIDSSITKGGSSA
jgi:glycosyltransferase involved in cell wall biosynthesis